MYICGAATSSLLGDTVVADYDTYKYIFRGTPINDYFLLNNTMIMLGMVGEGIKGALTAQGAAVTTPRVAIFAEELSWADPIVAGVTQLVAGLGYQLVYTARVPDDASSTVVATHLSAIEAAQTHIIFTIISGPVGLTYGMQMGVLQVPAMSVGINVEAQDPAYWVNTDGGASHQITLTTYTPNIRPTAKTGPFIDKFLALSGGMFPAYTAASYDIVFTLKEAIEAVGLGTDELIAYLENPANARVGTAGITAVYPDGLPAPFLRHDVMYGPTWVTGIGGQWLDGEIVGVWPKAEFGALANAICLFKPNIDWSGFEHSGTQMFAVATWMIASWMAYTP
jgi:branched-chain amino acid transport system substrate-binding protein